MTDNSVSMGCVSSYRDGASHKITNVPRTEAVINSHKNNRSNTIATNPQSWSSYKCSKNTRNKIQWMNKDRWTLTDNVFAIGITNHHTHRIEFIHALHMMLYEHHIVHCLLQFERIFLAWSDITQRLIQARHHRRQSIVAAGISKCTH